jgi:predicted ATPase
MGGAINAVCGFNGAGKSTILRCIRDVINGAQETTPSRILQAEIGIEVFQKGASQKVQKNAGAPFSGELASLGAVVIDTGAQIPLLQSFFRSVTNLDEELRQHEPKALSDKERELLNYLVGREYGSVVITELSEDYAQGNTILEATDYGPLRELAENDLLTHFKVETKGIGYAVDSMGQGELALFHLFWQLLRAAKRSIFLIEEPESFIATASQHALMDVLAHFVDTKDLWVFITTHSEHILSKIPDGNIYALIRDADGKHSLHRSTKKDEYLVQLRLEPRATGYLFCEDWVGILFAKRLLELEGCPLLDSHQFLPLFSDSKVEKMLQTYPKTRNVLPICGVLDGDVRAKINFGKAAVWQWAFLPGVRPPEELLISFARTKPDAVDPILRLNNGRTSAVLGTLEGLDFHDQLSDFSLRVDRQISWVVSALTDVWYDDPDNKKSTQDFVTELIAKAQVA